MDPYLSIILIIIGIAIVVFRLMYILKKIDKSVMFFLITISVIIFTAFFVDDIDEFFSDRPDSFVVIYRQDWYDKLEYGVPIGGVNIFKVEWNDLDLSNEGISIDIPVHWYQNQTISEGQTIYSIVFINKGNEIEGFLWIKLFFTDPIGNIINLYQNTITILTETEGSTMIELRANELLPLVNETYALGQTISIGVNGSDSNIYKYLAWTRTYGFNTSVYFCDIIFTF